MLIVVWFANDTALLAMKTHGLPLVQWVCAEKLILLDPQGITSITTLIHMCLLKVCILIHFVSILAWIIVSIGTISMKKVHLIINSLYRWMQWWSYLSILIILQVLNTSIPKQNEIYVWFYIQLKLLLVTCQNSRFWCELSVTRWHITT